jgi:calcineurin-like phosphoesterase family protein
MSKTWVYSDPHFGHANICKFTNYDGSKVRPWDDVTHMNEALVSNYNALVHPDDRVYILGDFAMSPGVFKSVMPRLLGRKVLVPGNHEPKGCIKWCAEKGIEVRGYVVKKGFIMSHIPIHPGSLSRWELNIHGHLHNNQVMKDDDWRNDQPDLRYYCACVERTGFAPMLLDDILKERGINQNNA